MKHLKKYSKFFEDGDSGSGDVSSNSTSMGGVISAQPGDIPGTFGTDGSGDIGFTFKKSKRKKGSPSEVSDLRDLEGVKINKVDDINESISVDNFTQNEIESIRDSILDLSDMGFKIIELKKSIDKNDIEVDDGVYSTFQQNRISISLIDEIENKWTGNLNINYIIEKGEVVDKSITTLRPSGKKLSKLESSILDEVYDACYRIINMIDYETCKFSIKFRESDKASNWSSSKSENSNVSIDIKFDENVYSDEVY